MSQTQQILSHLRQHGAITPIEALRKYGCFRLGARVYDLKRDGHDIQTHIVKRDGKRFARYSIAH